MGESYYKYVWIYTAGPYCGGILAGLFHMYHVYTTVAVLGNKGEVDFEIAEDNDKALMQDDDMSAYQVN